VGSCIIDILRPEVGGGGSSWPKPTPRPLTLSLNTDSDISRLSRMMEEEADEVGSKMLL